MYPQSIYAVWTSRISLSSKLRNSMSKAGRLFVSSKLTLTLIPLLPSTYAQRRGAKPEWVG